jgi:hypothetical protein
MKFTTGILVVALSMVFFYLRIAFLRGRKKRYEREYALKRRRVKGRSKGVALPAKIPGAPPYGINSWILVVISMLLIIFGLIMYNKMYLFGSQIIANENLITTYTPYWYVVVSAGVVLFSFCFKIDKPDLGDKELND